MSAGAAAALLEPPSQAPTAVAADDEEAGGPLKKRRFLEPSGLEYPTRGKHAQFLAFHLDVLQSLYNKNNDDHQAATDANTSSSVVDARVWKATQMFLEQRDQLMQAKEEAGCMKGIHDESLRFTTCEETATDHYDRNKETIMGNKSVSPTAATPHARNVANRKPSPVISQKPSFRGSFLSSQTSLYSPSAGGRCWWRAGSTRRSAPSL